jgi:hypothetical protein
VQRTVDIVENVTKKRSGEVSPTFQGPSPVSLSDDLLRQE